MRSDNKFSLFSELHNFQLRFQQLHINTVKHLLILFVVPEKSPPRLYNLIFSYPSQLLEIIHHLRLLIHLPEHSATCYEVKSHNSIRYSLGLSDLHPAHLARLIAVGAATRLHVHPVNSHHSQLIPGNHSPLIQPEPEIQLRLLFLLYTFDDLFVAKYNMVGCFFNLDFLVWGEGFKVGDVEVGLLGCLFCTLLSHVGAQHFSARCENNMSGGVVISQLQSSLPINLTLHTFIDQKRFDLS